MVDNIRNKPIVLTIAGFDPSSGAGLTADIRTLENIGVYGMSVCTAITIQNAEKVSEWIPIDAKIIRKQMEIVFSSYDIKIVKTGMLGRTDVVDLIVEFQKQYGFQLIVDPVSISGSGVRIAENDVENAIKNKLFPIAEVVTFNRYEAEYFSNKKITDAYSLQDICASIFDLGPKNIIVKGGHLDEESTAVIDYLFNIETFRFYPRERINIDEDKHIHGTGCVYSSLVAGFMALGYKIEECIFFTEDFMEETFNKVFPLKRGIVLDAGYTNEEIDVLLATQRVVEFICGNPEYSKFVPEVRTNVSISKRDAKTLEDIAGVEGRITIVNGIPVASGPIKFGATNHTGRLLLEAKKLDKDINAVLNIKYKPEYILALNETRLTMIDVNRLKQTKEMSVSENNSMQWIVREAYSAVNKIPDIIWDSGEPEKEPMIRLFAKNADDLTKKIKLFLNFIK